MTDRDLLEAAARAARIEILGFDPDGRYAVTESEGLWNPLRRDGDALRLVVRLGIGLDSAQNWVVTYAGSRMAYQFCERVGADPYAATRRAIVRAAAALAPDAAKASR